MPAMRNPLKELPLDSFVPSSHKTSTKRPMSPTSGLLSPSKRRILEVEGLYSPEKKRRATPSRSLFGELAKSPRSPARKLDFTSPRSTRAIASERDAPSRPHTPVSSAPQVPKLAPSPEIASSSSRASSTRDEEDDPMTPRPLPGAATVMYIPREIPEVSDKHSIHWPGFDVYIDPYIAIPTSASVAQQQTKEPETLEADETKENARPKRRVKSPAPDSATKALKFPRASSSAGPVNIMSLLSPPPKKTTMSPQQRQEQRKQGKIALLREVDGDDGDEENDVEQQI
ncbi:hypothetical protein M422DRAFT_33721 [Sphaerobolus stellatus SS14]|uniref:Uncharacterized protein n=1 Tax=Sphaerobolus stellatus (strain SS14) TaxID=990650 RepID=A0A0C9URG6_SPHS4|nr:hypothetical protein M422DRAFT_33721 [Sphaerobolus stellatus SS14]